MEVAGTERVAMVSALNMADFEVLGLSVRVPVAHQISWVPMSASDTAVFVLIHLAKLLWPIGVLGRIRGGFDCVAWGHFCILFSD